MHPANRAPTSPGDMLQNLLSEAEISLEEAAYRAKLSLYPLQRIYHGDGEVTAEIAHHLAIFFGTTPEYWLNLETSYQLWKQQPSDAVIQTIQPLQWTSTPTNQDYCTEPTSK